MAFACARHLLVNKNAITGKNEHITAVVFSQRSSKILVQPNPVASGLVYASRVASRATAQAVALLNGQYA